MFDPSKVRGRNEKQEASRNITAWIRSYLPVTIQQALQRDPVTVQINVREVQCGDPSCSPIDTALAFIFRNGRQAMTALPMESQLVLQEDIRTVMQVMEAELIAGFEDRDYVPPNRLPPLSPAGIQAMDRIAAVLRRELVALTPADIAGVCASAIDLLEQIEDDATRPPPQAMIEQAAPRPIDPDSKILSAAQKNDLAAVRLCVERDAISPSYANSLGQTPLHIAAMWGNADVAEYLVSKGANVHAINHLSSATPLHVAASSSKDIAGRTQCAQILLAAGANPNAADADGTTPWQKVGPGPLRDLLFAAANSGAA